MALADRFYVMHNGHIVDSLSAQKVQGRPELLHRHLGV
jgi:ABC-type branched-subunit amino acid transport system ATPase component